MVGIQLNFIQWSSTLTESAVHKYNNSILTNYRVIALCYLSVSGALFENYWLEFNTTLYNGQAHEEKVQCIRTITPFRQITELLPFDTFPCSEHDLKGTSWNSIQYVTMVKLLRGRAVHKNHDSFLTDLRVVALCYFLFRVHSLKNNGWNSMKLHTMFKGSEMKCSA
jgi:hypothetical protein